MDRYKSHYLFKLFILLLLIITTAVNSIYGQNDTLTFNSGEIVVGEIKYMSRGVIIIETAYSDIDFTIDWNSVSKMVSQQSYLITTSNGKRFMAKSILVKRVKELA